MPELYLTVKEVAEKLGYTPRSISRFCKKKIIPHFRVGNTVRIPQAWINKNLDTLKDAIAQDKLDHPEHTESPESPENTEIKPPVAVIEDKETEEMKKKQTTKVANQKPPETSKPTTSEKPAVQHTEIKTTTNVKNVPKETKATKNDYKPFGFLD